jgi:hypothetical protein
MNVKIIRSKEFVDYSMELRKVRIEFKDGTHMTGFINLHAKYANDDQVDSTTIPLTIDDTKFKFHRTSDYLRDCNQNEGMITIFNASYGDQQDEVCFVFLHSIKFISEEEVDSMRETTPQSLTQQRKTGNNGLSLRKWFIRKD